MDFLKCELCNIKELPKKQKDRTDDTLYMVKGELRFWRTGRILCIHNKRYTRCEECNLEGYKKTKELDKKQKIKHKEKTKEKSKEIYEKKYKNNEEYQKRNRDRSKKWFQNNKEKSMQYKKEYYKKNKKEIIKKTNEYRRNRKCEHNKRNDICCICSPNTYLVSLERARIHQLLKGKKDKHTTEYLGCNKKTLYNHLEKQFKDGMTWEKQGEWHIDHIRPCASFNLELEDERMKCFHYTNLQPLWAIDNITKNAKYNEKTHQLKWNGEKWIIK
jgi:hypothetical protein